jgi:MFS transporter, DHA1 family, tetracycline resistance protein
MNEAIKSNPLFRLYTIMLFDHTSLNITFPVLTFIFFDIHSRLFEPATSQAIRSMWYGICVAIPHIVILFAAPLLSCLSDSYGRKPLLAMGMLGAFVFAVSAGMGILWGSLFLLLAGRIVQGLFARTNPIAQAVVGDVTLGKGKVVAMAYLQLAISIGACIGPIIGGYFARRFYFQELNYALPYFIASVIAFIGFLATLILFKETLTHTQSRQRLNWSSIKKVMSQPGVARISILLLLCQLSWSTYYQFMPPILKGLFHFDSIHLGLFVGLIALWLALATAFGVRILIKKLKVQHVITLSIYMVLVGLLLTLAACYIPSIGRYLIWFAAIPTAVGDVVAYTCITAIYSNFVSHDEQGKVMGLCFVIVSATWAFTALVGGWLVGFSLLAPVYIAPVGIILLLIINARSRFTF